MQSSQAMPPGDFYIDLAGRQLAGDQFHRHFVEDLLRRNPGLLEIKLIDTSMEEYAHMRGVDALMRPLVGRAAGQGAVGVCLKSSKSRGFPSKMTKFLKLGHWKDQPPLPGVLCLATNVKAQYTQEEFEGTVGIGGKHWLCVASDMGVSHLGPRAAARRVTKLAGGGRGNP